MTHLHILNGLSTKSIFEQSGIHGDVVVWDAMLVEGPTDGNLRDPAFWEQRSEFMQSAYGIDPAEYRSKTLDELNRLRDIARYYEVTLWFEYDLYCQVNMLACLSYIRHDKISIVCVGNEDGDWKGLGEHTPDRFQDFFLDRLQLDNMDIRYATQAWQAYACDEPHRLYPFINHNEHFPYLSDALSAHLRRFPIARSGLNEQETEILKRIAEGVKDKKEVIRHMLQWQYFYGFGDTQYERMLEQLAPFVDLDQLTLTELGAKTLKKVVPR